MKSLFTFLAAGFIVVGTAMAAPLQPSEALDRALAGNPAKKQAYGGGGIELVYTAKSKTLSDVNCFYVFNRSNGGYLIVTADDRLPAIIGYSDGGRYDADNVPPQMQWWLDGYASDISEFIASDAPAYKHVRMSGVRKEAKKDIAPLVSARWDQDSPYWNDCPKKGGSRCYTGCVATAMAQVMKYHQWPEQGTGSRKYYWKGGKQNLSCDFSEITFKWNLMDDVYTSSSSAESNAAVAELMYACGVSVKMEYGNARDGGSGALTTEIPGALVRYFGYSEGISYEQRKYYTTSKWVDLVYDELAASRPVLYGGDGAEGGHQFVCDGYRASDGFFHFNWGWSGDSDGYFALDALNPGDLGAGGGAGGFNQTQDVVIGIKKAQAGEKAEPDFGSFGDFTLSEVTKDYHIFSFANSKNGYNGFYNNSEEDFEGTVGVRIESDGEENVYAVMPVENNGPYVFKGMTEGGAITIYNNIAVDLSGFNLEKGKTYRAYPVISADGEYYPIKVENIYQQYAEFTGSDEPGEVKTYQIDVTDFTYSPVVAGEDMPVELTVCNTGEATFMGTLIANISTIDEATLEPTDAFKISMDMSATPVGPGETVTVKGKITSAFKENGIYTIEFECDGESVSDVYIVFVGYKISSITMPEQVELNLDQETTYQITPAIQPENASWKRLNWESSDVDVATVSETGLVSAVGEGVANITAESTDGSDIIATCVVSVSKSSGIGIVGTDVLCDVFTPEGIVLARSLRLDSISELPSGLYIIRTSDKTFKYNKK